MKIGLLGGTFDPVHLGHLILAQNVKEHFALNRIIFIPSQCPPHKEKVRLTSTYLRLNMLKAAIGNNRNFSVSELELNREGLSYTYDTIQWFRRKYSKRELFFIMGSDSLLDIRSWFRINELVKQCEFILVERPGFEIKCMSASELEIKPSAFAALTAHVLRMNLVDISSRDIRKRVAEGKSIRYLLPEKVISFIEKNGLYREVDY